MRTRRRIFSEEGPGRLSESVSVWVFVSVLGKERKGEGRGGEGREGKMSAGCEIATVVKWLGLPGLMDWD